MMDNPDATRGRSRTSGAIDLKQLSNDYRPLFRFNGIANQRITTSNTTVYQAFTYSAWVKWEAGGGSYVYEIISKRSYYAAGVYQDFVTAFAIDANRKLYCHVDSGNDWSADLIVTSTQILSEGVWYHVAATYNSPNLILYVNGEPTSSSGAVTLNTSNTRPWTIGNSSADYDAGTNTCMFKGWISDPRIYNVAKSKNEIINIKNGYDDRDGLMISFSKTNLPVARIETQVEPPAPTMDGCIGWFPVDKQVGYSDGDLVSTWTDFSGTANATSAGAARPTYKTAIINNRPVIRFAGAHYIDRGAVTLTQGCWFVVWKRTNSANNDGVLLYDSTHYAYLQFGDTWYYGTSAYVTIPVVADTFKLKFVSYSGTKIKMYTNGKMDYYFDSTISLYLRYMGSTVGALNGDIAEVIYYNREVTDSERISIENYLNYKYNIW